MDNATGSLDSNKTHQTPLGFSADYRIVATVLHSLIILFGTVGNILVVVVVRKTKALQIPTYCYLESLAVSDLLVIWICIPEAIVSYQIYGNQWILGPAGCSLMIFLSFLGINASSLSILAFTVERFIAVCHPLLAKNICTLNRAKKISLGLWIVAIISASPWLALTVVRPSRRFPEIQECGFRISRRNYTYIFGIDFLLFYIVPLVTASILYGKIGLALHKRTQSDKLKYTRSGRYASIYRSVKRFDGRPVTGMEKAVIEEKPTNTLTVANSLNAASTANIRQSRSQVLRMLILVVVLFAILWLPYRGISLYNVAFAVTPILDKWIMLFAKTCIFLNASINPFLYNAMSRRFRLAFLDTLLCRQRSAAQTRRITYGTTVSPSPSSIKISVANSPRPSPLKITPAVRDSPITAMIATVGPVPSLARTVSPGGSSISKGLIASISTPSPTFANVTFVVSSSSEVSLSPSVPDQTQTYKML